MKTIWEQHFATRQASVSSSDKNYLGSKKNNNNIMSAQTNFENKQILKAVQGSFNQGNERFGLTAGRQCTCNALTSVAFTLIKSQGT